MKGTKVNPHWDSGWLFLLCFDEEEWLLFEDMQENPVGQDSS